MFAKNLLLVAVLQLCMQASAQYVRPLWYDRLEEEDDSGLLKRCFKRQGVPPQQGRRCARRPKLCYFGTQDCDGVGAHPETRCFCDGHAGSRTWNCTIETCPVLDSTNTGCPEPGQPIDHGNSDSCPDNSPISGGETDSCTSANDGVSCTYGQESCCGQCFASNRCSCAVGPEDESFWACLFTDACFVPPCEFTDWSNLLGSTCLEARTQIFAVFPGMTVICLSESTPPPSDNDRLRYLVMTDDNTGAATSVLFNRPIMCPTEKTDSCNGQGQTCSFEVNLETETESCTATEVCTCNFFSFSDCQATSISCLPKTPPSVTGACPDAPPGENVGCVNDLTCTYSAQTSLPDGSPCTETTTCACTSPGDFLCNQEIACVSANPPSVTDVCPAGLPRPNTACTVDLQCMYSSPSSTPGPDGITCTEATTCSCTSFSGDFVCLTEVLCSGVSPNPPSITTVCPDDPPGPNEGCEGDLTCTYTGASSLPDGSPCSQLTTCFCARQEGARTGDFLCAVDITGCISANSPSITDVCLEKLPGANVGCTTDLTCTYSAPTTDFPGCMEATTCTCTASGPGDFLCAKEILCSAVSENPPSLSDACPDQPPGENVGCTVDLTCTYSAQTSLDDGSPCTETTTCACTSPGDFLCLVETACVSANPPSIP